MLSLRVTGESDFNTINPSHEFIHEYIHEQIINHKLMSTQKIENHNIRKLSKVGGGRTFAVTIPVEFIRKLGWKEKQKIVLILKGRHLLIKDWRP